MTIAVDQPRPPRPKRWTAQEHNDWVERGVFQGQRLYLPPGAFRYSAETIVEASGSIELLAKPSSVIPLARFFDD